MPTLAWEAQPLSRSLGDPALAAPEAYLARRRDTGPCFFFEPARRARYQALLRRWPGAQAIHDADALASGHLRYFGHTLASLGMPPDWHRNPFTGDRAPADRHWSEIDDAGHGDIKVIWEPSRFGFTYTLVRAYWRTGDERYPELFWALVEDWRRRNPPQRGPNWMCGQEISFRVMAWCFGLYGFLSAPATTAGRVAGLAQMVAASGQRIEANLGYALSQRNNHGISEAMGLWTIGLLFPELRDSARWRERGRSTLERLGRELIYDDGSFVQHSLNYQRLMLHDYLWALRLGDLNGQPLSTELRTRVGAAGRLLYRLQDHSSGRVPCYGQNDGALVLPLSSCDYDDFSPAVQATHYLCHGSRCYPDGPWDEDLLWLFGPEALASPQAACPWDEERSEESNLNADIGGYYTLRNADGLVVTRCASYRHRPGQADMLHADLWWKGQNIALDAGTYSYNAPAPWDNPLGGTAYHNTVSVDGLDQMARAGRFLWLPWTRGRVRYQERSSEGHLVYWEGEHDGYRRLRAPVRHRRAIVGLGGGWWLVVDGLASWRAHDYRLHWLLADLPHRWDGDARQLVLRTPAGRYHMRLATLTGGGALSLVRADPHSPRGWRAPSYYKRQPALSVALTAHARSVVFWTLFAPEPGRVVCDGATLAIHAGSWLARLNIGASGRQPLVTSVSVSGSRTDRLEVKLHPQRQGRPPVPDTYSALDGRCTSF